MQASEHHFHALAFVENLPLKELSVAYPGARRTLHELSFTVKLDGASDGSVFIYPFGAVVFQDVPPERRD
ncbi:MAG TPA: hypothetical protein VNN72_07520, partial [Polyangiaceae bacterium]|nr:hypothetical protein [Polyangiaceae bacterium]